MNQLRPRFYIRDVLKFTAIVCAVLALFSWSGLDLALQTDWWMSVYPLGVALLFAFSVMRPRAKSPRCESCGRPFFRTRKGEMSGLCPACSNAKVSPEQRRRLAIQGFVIIFILLLMLTFVLAYPVQARFGGVGYPIIAIGVFVFLFVVCAGGFVLQLLVRMRRMFNPAHALKVARACARDVGEEMTCGPVSIYAFGANAPTLILKDQWEICRSRFESLIGEPLEVERPLRLFVFGKRNAFDVFFREAFLYGSNVDGIYVPWSTPTISLTTEFPAYRLANLERMTRALLSYFNLDSFRRSPSPLWLQVGIANFVADGGDQEERFRLNRKMIAFLSRGDSLGTAELFHRNPRSVIKLVRDWQEFDNFTRYSQLIAQSSSVVEFLCSESRRRERFRAFLKESRKKTPIEEVFQRHFDHGFDTLLQQWRQWVLNRVIGSHGSPPDDVRDVLMNRVIPIVEDEGANMLERIQAVREMGRVGYALGADALIDQLGKNQIPSKEIVWALESISGLALGNDLGKWTGWFNQLPIDATYVADLART